MGSVNIVIANILIFSVFFASGCAIRGGEYRELRLKRKIPVPYQLKPEKYIETDEIVYLLVGDKKRYSRQVIDSAVGGAWRESKNAWLSMQQQDCRIRNNAGIASLVLGELQQAQESISMALSECPDSREIRLNYRAIMNSGGYPDPVYTR